MFEDLNWKSAARRSATVVAIYLALFYVLSRIAPRTFGFDNRAEIISLLINAVFFFFIFTVVYAFIERSRNRRMAELRQKNNASRPATDGTDAGRFKGRPNPNTSRKKTRRKR